jgi:hypothetical protein
VPPRSSARLAPAANVAQATTTKSHRFSSLGDFSHGTPMCILCFQPTSCHDGSTHPVDRWGLYPARVLFEGGASPGKGQMGDEWRRRRKVKMVLTRGEGDRISARSPRLEAKSVISRVVVSQTAAETQRSLCRPLFRVETRERQTSA